ncbi:hypothetical protein GCM10010429_47360 [Micromonospora olivasterospora]|uniref:Putative transposase of IS4/5 family DUF4096 n=1 Tax=Micromonospora olivasterospora TaxID=1880 RepID=A0A562IJ48_MICOL|nr:putative transposase of IS4/5 family DUF4096 [Micromonospora olivasterospora]
MPAIPAWLIEPLWVQFTALLPDRPTYAPTHPLGCHRRRVDDRIVFDKLIQVLRFGCSYEAIADATCSAATIRGRRDEWIRLGVFTQLKQIAVDAYDRLVGLVLNDIAVDGCITKAPGGGECAGQAVGVLVRSALPGRVRVAEVDGHPGGDGELLVRSYARRVDVSEAAP